MNIFTTTLKNNIKTLAIGCFDGVHLGHRKLIECLDDSGALLIIDKFKGKTLYQSRQSIPSSKRDYRA